MPARPVFHLAVLLAAVTGVLAQACSNLTQPPPPDRIEQEPVASAATTARPAASASAPQPAAPAQPPPGPEEKVTIVEMTQGKGTDTVKAGDKVEVLYKGSLPDGTVFDESAAHGNTPLPFTVGSGVIKGFSDGVTGMKLGGKRKVTIPPTLGYGARPQGKIPPNSTLTFEIELVKLNGKSK
jgi:FKBP-type peptidyl-prolyl cis-trans isomerase